MHHAINVSYDIKDVIPVVDKKKTRTPTYNSNSFSRPKTAIFKAPILSPEKPISPKNNSQNNSQNINNTQNNTRPRSANGTIRPSSANGSLRRSNNNGPSIYHHESAWVSDGTCANRDIMRMNQDSEISRYRSKHIDIYADIGPDMTPHPSLATDPSLRTVKKNKSVIQRERFVSNTAGSILNDSLPFHPALKEINIASHHPSVQLHDSVRWTGTTLPIEDPERSRPASSSGRKTQAHFHQEFQSGRFTFERTGTVEILGRVSAVNSVVH